jgi:hypothetical protein
MKKYFLWSLLLVCSCFVKAQSLNQEVNLNLQEDNTESNEFSSNIVTCPDPNFLSTGNLRSTSITLSWSNSVQNSVYEVQYKTLTDASWTSIPSIATNSITLNNLSPNTTYQWKVKTSCPDNSSSNFITGNNFTTACPNPIFLGVSNLLSTSARLSWAGYEQNAQFEVQYKTVSSSTWTTIINIPSSGNDGSINISNLSPNTTYQWKVKTLCLTGNPSDFITGNNFTTACPNPNYLGVSNLLSTSARLSWAGYEQNTQFEVQYKTVSSSTWTTITNIPSSGNDGSIVLNNLNPNNTYQWRVRTVCLTGNPSDFITGNNFTTLCSPPTGLGTGNTTLSTTDLIWLSVSAGINYEVRYRPQGTTAWATQTVTAPTPTANSTIVYNITGLSQQTTYEWQVRTICNPLNTTFSSLATFTTACPVPTNVNTTELAANSAKLNWNLGLPSTTSDLQWRLVGSNTWTIVTGLTSGTYTLTGLNVGTAYEWQVRTNCSASVNSAYSTPINFTTVCPSLTNLSVANLLPNSAQLNWSGGYAGGNYSLQWRLQSSGTFTTVNNIATASYNLTGLTAGSAYVWQVRLNCTPTVSTTYAGPNTFNTPTSCTSMFTLKNGLWNDPSVWSCNRLPTNLDVVTIKNVITVPTGYNAQSLSIIYDQAPTIIFQQPTSLDLAK